MTTYETDGRRDFDFLHGVWRVHNRLLARRLDNCTEWREFDAEGDCRPVIRGLGNVDTFVASRDGEPYEGLALRLFDPTTRLWSIYWSDNRYPTLQPPVVGRFTDGAGHFSGGDHHHDLPIIVRFTWSGITPVSARWEQAFSLDHGQTWEINWIMSFSRR